MRIALGSDHAALDLKEQIKVWLVAQGEEVLDEGTNSADPVDYPDVAKLVCARVKSQEADLGLLLCGTGIGMSIAANKYPGIRAALCLFPEMAELARRHNDANILVLGGRLMGLTLAQWTVKRFLDTPFEGGRHQLRIDKIAHPTARLETDDEGCL